MVAGGGIQSTLRSMLPLTSRRSGPGAHSWHRTTSKSPVKNEPGACKPLGSWLQGAKSLLIPHSLPWPLGSPHAQQSCIPKATALSPGEACTSQASLRENGGAGTSHAGLCRLMLLLAPCSSPQRCPQCPVPVSPSVRAGWIASTSAAAWGAAPGKVLLRLGSCMSPCFKP